MLTNVRRREQATRVFIYAFARWLFQRNDVTKVCNFVILGQINEYHNRPRTEAILHIVLKFSVDYSQAQQPQGPGETGPPTFRLGTNNVWVPLTCWPWFSKSKKFYSKQSPECRIQHLSFQKFSGGDIPGPSQWEVAIPSRTQHPAWPLAGRGTQALRCLDPNLAPPP